MGLENSGTGCVHISAAIFKLATRPIKNTYLIKISLSYAYPPLGAPRQNIKLFLNFESVCFSNSKSYCLKFVRFRPATQNATQKGQRKNVNGILPPSPQPSRRRDRTTTTEKGPISRRQGNKRTDRGPRCKELCDVGASKRVG